jgi:hypothetical protein
MTHDCCCLLSSYELAVLCVRPRPARRGGVDRRESDCCCALWPADWAAPPHLRTKSVLRPLLSAPCWPRFTPASSALHTMLAAVLFVAAATFATTDGGVGGDSSSVIVVGDVRVSALSPTLVRVEAKGPKGYEDRSTMNVVGRGDFEGLSIRTLNTSDVGTWLATSAYHVFVPAAASPPPPSEVCADAQPHTDSLPGMRRSPTYPNGTHVASSAQCCTLCTADAKCEAWVAATPKPAADANADAPNSVNCWPLSQSSGPTATPKPGRTYGRVRGFPSGLNKGVIVSTSAGRVVYSGANTGSASTVAANLLHWPSPLESTAYAFNDYPRFTVPEWGPTPIPSGSNVPAHLVATNGYDFTNDADGDSYIFLLGDDLASWWAARADFLRLTGPTPLLPDFAYGIWYTWYVVYTEQRAKDEIGNWTAAKFPLDVWGLGMRIRSDAAAAFSQTQKPAPGRVPLALTLICICCCCDRYELAQCRCWGGL